MLEGLGSKTFVWPWFSLLKIFTQTSKVESERMGGFEKQSQRKKSNDKVTH